MSKMKNITTSVLHACAGGRMCSGTLPGGTVSKMKNITTSVLHGVSTKNRKGKQILFHSGPGRA
ncbi:hypothetical protein, partial [Escherichia coli]|uniref:hypothetical protein n=1 Tax=Escherichia coli TaxID=562 RepID=UPI001BD41501